MNIEGIDLMGERLARATMCAALAIVDAVWVSDLSPSELRGRLGIGSNLQRTTS
jgi:hypothetical protein